MGSVGKAIVKSAGEVFVKKAAEKFWEYMGTCGSDGMQYLKRNWQVLNGKASDIEDQVKREEMSGKKKRKREVEDWLKEVEKLKPTFDDLEARGPCWRPTLSEDPVGKMQNQVNELIEQSHHFDRLVLDAFGNIGEPCCPTKLFGEKTKQNLERIWPCLVTDGISNIGIYGMAGVGKTTLAKQIEYRLLKNTNYQVFWVTVSQEFSIHVLQDKIAIVLNVSLSDKDEEKVRANILHWAMREKGTFVLMLDDVWDDFSVEKIGISLGASKCRLILTTRSLEVCNRMSCQRKFGVETLDEYESWDLFKYTLQSTELRAGVETIAKFVTQRCGGLPLAIITVAGSMRGVTDIHEWRNTLAQLNECSDGHNKMGSDVFPILEWSYSRLNGCQRHCFLYCCLYPEDKDIPREELINIFICAELMDRRSTRNLEIDQGHAILNHLIRVCLLKETTDMEGNKCVKMHDLIRDMALRITSGKNSLETTKDAPRFLVNIVDRGGFSKIKSELKEEWREDLSAVSINLIGTERLGIPMDMSPTCPNLSTLLFQHHCYSKSPPFDKIPSSFFNQMRGLKVLKLTCSFIKQLPDIISDMVNLTALLLSWCLDLASVPPLGKLSQLRILDLSNTKIEDIPEGLERLFNLEVICLGKRNLKMKRIPKGTLSKLRHLQQLRLDSKVVVDDPEVLNQLEVFCGCLSSVDVYNQHINFERLKHYQIQVGEGNFFSHQVTENGLVFYCCNFHGGSNVGIKELPQDIQELTLHSCIGMDKCISDVFLLSSSNELSYLTIKNSAEVEFLLKLSSSPPDEPVMSPCGPFQKLLDLRLIDLPNFIELFNWDSKALHRHLPPGTFSSLIMLEIWRCKKMRKLFTVQLLQNLQNLEVLSVYDCEELEEIVADDIEVGSGGGCIQSTSAGATNTLILPKLNRLSVYKLPKLKNICKGTIICSSIRFISVTHCPKLKRLPLFPPSPPNTDWEIHGAKKWWESLEWDNPNSKNALDPFFLQEEEEDFNLRPIFPLHFSMFCNWGNRGKFVK